MPFSTTVTLFGKLQLYGMIDYKLGQYNYNFDEVVRCSINLVCEAIWHPEKYDPAYIAEAAVASSTNINSRFIQKTDFARLRELSASLTLPANWVRAVGASHGVLTVAGRNLHTWTSYPGLDPETHAQTGGPTPFALASVREYSQAQVPLAAQLVTSIRLTF